MDVIRLLLIFAAIVYGGGWVLLRWQESRTQARLAEFWSWWLWDRWWR